MLRLPRSSLLLLLAAVPLRGQEATPPFPVSIVGRVIDSTTGAGVRRAHLCTANHPTHRCGVTDTAGTWRVDSLLPGTWRFQLSCTTGYYPFGGKSLGDSVMLTASAEETTFRTLRVSDRGCDKRPFTDRDGAFDGVYYTDHFETGWFFPDALPGALADADFTIPFRRGDLPAWPRSTSTSTERSWGWTMDCYRLSLDGRLRGPWSLRAGGGYQQYTLAVTRVRRARATSMTECRAAQRRTSWAGANDEPAGVVALYLRERHRATGQTADVALCASAMSSGTPESVRRYLGRERAAVDSMWTRHPCPDGRARREGRPLIVVRLVGIGPVPVLDATAWPADGGAPREERYDGGVLTVGRP